MIFDQEKITNILSTLASYEARAVYFLSIGETSKLLAMTEYEVRYSIMAYRLDAFLFIDGYRIAIESIREFVLGNSRDVYYEFISMMRLYEISGVYDLNFNKITGPIIESLERLHRPQNDITELLYKDKKLNYFALGKDCDNEDLYDLGSLAPWPDKALVGDYAKVLRINASSLADLMGINNIYEPIDWLDMYDFLVEREFANLQIPNEMPVRKGNSESFSQPELF